MRKRKDQSTIAEGFGRLVVSHNTRLKEVLPVPDFEHKPETTGVESAWETVNKMIAELREQHGSQMKVSVGKEEVVVDLDALESVAGNYRDQKNARSLEALFLELGRIDIMMLFAHSLVQRIKPKPNNR